MALANASCSLRGFSDVPHGASSNVMRHGGSPSSKVRAACRSEMSWDETHDPPPPKPGGCLRWYHRLRRPFCVWSHKFQPIAISLLRRSRS